MEPKKENEAMSQFHHSGGILPAHSQDVVSTLTLIIDGKAVWMKWLGTQQSEKK